MFQDLKEDELLLKELCVYFTVVCSKRSRE